MKIKEVIEKTGLTDRAIRLYIDEGLIAPSIGESYSGRKSIEFSQEDVERLKNVAMLRKAGFPIADIKSIVDDESTIKSIVEKFIEQTEENIAHETEIVEKLKGISFDTEVTLETVCRTLSETVEEKQLPKEDLKTPLWERIFQKSFVVFAVVAVLLSVTALLYHFFTLKDMFIHLHFAEGAWRSVLLSYGGWILAIVLSVILLAINAKQRKSKQKRNGRIAKSSALSLLIVLLCIFSSLSSVLGIIIVSPVVYSLSTNPEDYLVLDDYINEDFGDEIDMVFPDEIPEAAIKLTERDFDNSGYPFTTHYFYRHTWVLDPDFDLVAEWVLPQYEFEKAKKQLIGKEKYSFNKDDWTLLIFSDEYDYFPREENPIAAEQKFWNNDWESDRYWFLFFAYNNKTNKVRYIASYAIDSYPDGPYYLSLDW